MAALSVLVIPFLYAISRIAGNELVMLIGVRASLASIVYLWCVYLLFRKLRERKIMAAAFSLLLTIPLSVLINISLADILSSSPFDVWGAVSFAIISLCAIVLLHIDALRSAAKRRKAA